MSLKTVDIVEKYDSGFQNVVEDFYIPALKECVYYDRIAGFFTSTSLLISFRGLESLIKNNGKIRLIVSPRLSEIDIETIGNYGNEIEKYISTNFEQELSKVDTGVVPPTDVLAWLLANNFLEIKIAVVLKGNRICNYEEVNDSAIFHQKVGVLVDSYGNTVSFSGSINETAKAWLDNNEEFKTFKSWIDGQKTYCMGDVDKFNSYWNNEISNVKVMPFPHALKTKLIENAPKNIDFDSRSVQRKLFRKNDSISLFSYQEDAKKKWLESGHKMLFEMATGTGKTRTAIACIQQELKDYKRNLVVVCTPEETLTEQWKSEIQKLKVEFDETIFASGSYKWRKQLEENILLLNIGVLNNLLVLTTHDTVSNKEFINELSILKTNIINTLLVGDEVHGLGSSGRKRALNDLYSHRIGLSATPTRWFDEDGSELIKNYFGNNSFVFGIEDALTTINPLTNKFFLCNYKYYVEKVELTDKEMIDFKVLSDKIAKRRLLKKMNGEEDDDHLLEEKRANIVKSAENKLLCLENLLLRLETHSIKNTIIFCSPKLIDEIGFILKKLNIIFSTFTKDTGKTRKDEFKNRSERQYIIEQFKEEKIQVLLAIKCLDEGIDIPTAERAILVSSTTNPREYIQRIGRVIRQSDNKKMAYIHDFIVTASDEYDDSIIDKLERNERKRSLYIAQYASNNASCLNDLNKIFKGGLGPDDN